LGLIKRKPAADGDFTSKVSGLTRGDFSNLSERKLMECLNRLGYDIEIKLSPAADTVGCAA